VPNADYERLTSWNGDAAGVCRSSGYVHRLADGLMLWLRPSWCTWSPWRTHVCRCWPASH